MECAMKKLLLSLVVFSGLLMVGCEENSITDPNPAQVNTGKNSGSEISGTIQLQATLDNPYPVFNSYIMIDGTVDYQLTINYLDPIPPNPQEIISVQLEVNAELTNICTVCMPPVSETYAGAISSVTRDNLYTTSDGLQSITKSFPILKRDDGMVLKCTFLINTTSITLEAMRLELDPRVPVLVNRTD
jgi:hypothetical protein